ncbi:PTS sugar transporter subunit IIA, partial [Enterococcus faecalis]
LWLKTLYRKRAVTWPFIFYTIIWTLSENEQLKVKKEISRFTRKLANEDFLEKLLRLKTETDFYKIIEKFEEEK